MKIFDFFKNLMSSTEKAQNKQKRDSQNESLDMNVYFIRELQIAIEQLGYEVERMQKYVGIKVNADLEIASARIDGDYHPSVLNLLVFTIHEKFFPKGIETTIVGVGKTNQEKVESAISSYLMSIFPPIMDGFSDSHDADADFENVINGRKILWHPKQGDVLFIGDWRGLNQNTILYDLLKEAVKDKLQDQKFNWLKLYISRQPNQKIYGECSFNNELWEEGWHILHKYISELEYTDSLIQQKQFIMFRRCDAYDI